MSCLIFEGLQGIERQPALEASWILAFRYFEKCWRSTTWACELREECTLFMCRAGGSSASRGFTGFAATGAAGRVRLYTGHPVRYSP